MSRTRNFCKVFVSATLLLRSVSQTNADEPSKTFEKVVAPAIAAKCVACHREDNLKGGLDLTTRANATKGGDSGPALVPGKSSDSPLYMRAVSTNGQVPEMPAKGEPLTAEEAEALKAWIDAAAPWPETMVLREKAKADASFWSFQPIKQLTPS